MSKFYIESIIAHGSGKTDAVVSFGKGLNIIQGYSDTGKTCVVKCIDYIFGSSENPFDKNTFILDIRKHTMIRFSELCRNHTVTGIC